MPSTTNAPWSTEERGKRKTACKLRPLALYGAVQGLVLEQQLPTDKLSAYRTVFSTLISLFPPAILALQRQSLIQTTRAGRSASGHIRELGTNLGDYGLGIFPEAEPPRSWKREDFENLTLADQPAPLFFDIMRARSKPEALRAVEDKFLGSGAYVEAYCPNGQDFYGAATKQFKPMIRDAMASMYPYHAPILQRKSVEAASVEELESWMCGAHLYIRESTEDNGVLFLYRCETQALLERAIEKNETLETWEFVIA